MGRPVFTYELGDPDFSWLVSNFQENNPEYTLLESSSLPVVFVNTVEYADSVCYAEDEEDAVEEAERTE